MKKHSPSIEVGGLTKHYGATVAVSDLTFEVQPGLVTGFLGPNGSGKSTTLRMILGLDAPTEGFALVNGRPFSEHHEPLFDAAVRFRTVGDMTCTGAVRSSARNVDEIIDEVTVATITERGATRADDRMGDAAMEDRKREGYF